MNNLSEIVLALIAVGVAGIVIKIVLKVNSNSRIHKKTMKDSVDGTNNRRDTNNYYGTTKKSKL